MRTKVYKRLPPDSGTPVFDQQVHLSGFRDIKIESRVIAERQIADFMKYCERDADQPAARMLLGAWGEGKTEAFFRYIKPMAKQREHQAFLLPARSIVNAYGHYEKLDTSEARLFLSAVFHVLTEEHVTLPKLRPQGLEKWIEDCLHALGCEKRKLYLFVDEVEQLLHEPYELRRIMLGIKQILDGKLESLMSGGNFAGALFIFFACTPEAYNRIATDPDVRQVFGGYGRRMDKISVDKISLNESVEFIYGLLKYAYNDKLPDPPPITSPGVLRTIATIAKHNMGHMVSLTTRLLSSLDQKDGTMEVIGPAQLVQFAKGRTINIEGYDTKCFEDDLYNLILRKINEIETGGEYYSYLLTTMLFDQKAFSMKDVATLFDREMWRGMEKLWVMFLNKVLIDLGYSPGLLCFKLLTGRLQQEAFYNNLEMFQAENKKGAYRFSEKLFEKRDIEDLLTNWALNDQIELVGQILVPANVETVQHLFGPLRSDDVDKLISLFKDFAIEGEDVYRLSKDLINQVFPPPCPSGLEFIRDASERFNLWRRATIQYTERLNQDVPCAVVALASFIDKPWKFGSVKPLDIGSQIFSTMLTYEIASYRNKVSLFVWIIARSRITDDDVLACQKLLTHSAYPPHLVVFISNDPIEANIVESMSQRLRKRVCFFTIHPTYAKQILASFWHVDAEGGIYEEVLKDVIKVLFDRDLNIYSSLDNWLTLGRANGLVVDNPTLSEGTYKGLVNALRLLLNAQGTNMSLKEVFDWNRNVLRELIPFGSKTGLVPETDRLESFDGFRALVGDLQTNGFISIDSENRPIFKISPCESAILEELNAGEISRYDWNKYLRFIRVLSG